MTVTTSSLPAPPSGGLSPTNSSVSTPNAAATVSRLSADGDRGQHHRAQDRDQRQVGHQADREDDQRHARAVHAREVGQLGRGPADRRGDPGRALEAMRERCGRRRRSGPGAGRWSGRRACTRMRALRAAVGAVDEPGDRLALRRARALEPGGDEVARAEEARRVALERVQAAQRRERPAPRRAAGRGPCRSCVDAAPRPRLQLARAAARRARRSRRAARRRSPAATARRPPGRRAGAGRRRRRRAPARAPRRAPAARPRPCSGRGSRAARRRRRPAASRRRTARPGGPRRRPACPPPRRARARSPARRRAPGSAAWPA